MDGFAIFVAFPAVVCAGLVALRLRTRPRWYWTTGLAGAALLAVITAALVAATGGPNPEGSPLAAGFMVALPLVLAMVTVAVGAITWGRVPAWLLASVIMAVTMPPSYGVGCGVAEVFPGPGCFF